MEEECYLTTERNISKVNDMMVWACILEVADDFYALFGYMQQIFTKKIPTALFPD